MLKSFYKVIFVLVLILELDSVLIAQDFWFQTNGPIRFEAISSLAVSQNGDIFAGNYNGILRSTNNGDSWIHTGFTESVSQISFINSNNNILAGTDNGVFKSSDNGESWIQTGLSASIGPIATNTNGYVFAGVWSSKSVFRSTDNGDNWTQTGLSGFWVHALAINSSGDIFAGTSQYSRSDTAGVFRSTNNGDNWSLMTGSPEATELAINIYGHIFAGTGNEGIFRSTNNGDTWVQINDGLDAGAVLSLAVNTIGHIFASIRNSGVYRSTNNGDTWFEINNGLTAEYVLSLATNANGNVIAGTASDGFFRSIDNGDSWSSINNGLEGTYARNIQTLSISPEGNIFVGASGKGAFYSTDNGYNWTKVFGLSDQHVSSFAFNSIGSIFAGTSNGVFRSTDNGIEWVPISYGFVMNVTSLAVNLSGDIYAGTGWCDSRCSGSGVYRSSNNGETWDRTGLTDGYIKTLVINSNGHIFASVSSGPWVYRGLFRSADDGNSWINILDSTVVNEIAINENGNILAGINNSVFRSNDNGENWTQLFSVSALINEMVFNSNGNLFIATNGAGVFRDSIQINDGLTDLNVLSLAVNSGGYIFAGTNNSGVFRSTQSTTPVKEIFKVFPSSFELYQNYPNPFNPSTTISWQSPISIWQTLKIYDLLGREVATLVNEYKPAGRYEVEFNGNSYEGKNLSSGVYFYWLQAGEFTYTKKLILMK